MSPLPRAMWSQVGLSGSPQVNEVAFSPSESHCATCSDDGSVRVWSLASMELVIQFQVLNQVLGDVCRADRGPALPVCGRALAAPPALGSVCGLGAGPHPLPRGC